VPGTIFWRMTLLSHLISDVAGWGSTPARAVFSAASTPARASQHPAGEVVALQPTDNAGVGVAPPPPKISKAIAGISLLLFLVISVTCAKRLPPPGGPEDKIPPVVVTLDPKSGSTNVPLDTKIRITFDEHMEQKKTSEALFISPSFREPPKLKWKGRTLIVEPKEPLLGNRTYVVTIGTGACDLRRNPLAASITFAFSTGDSIDTGSISGVADLEGKRQSGLSLWAYLLGDSLPDPIRVSPDYITQTGEDGSFKFSYLGLGSYRLFATTDKNRDLLWDPGVEPLGIAAGDVVIGFPGEEVVGLAITATKRDTLKPVLLGCQLLQGRVLEVEFEKEILKEGLLDPESFLINPLDTALSPPTTVSLYSYREGTKSVFILLEGLVAKAQYRLEARNLFTSGCVPLDDSANFCLFSVPEIADTVGPAIHTVSPSDKSVAVSLDTIIVIEFSEPMDTASVNRSFSLTDTLLTAVEGQNFWSSPISFLFKPDSLLLPNTVYLLNLELDSCADLSGNPLADTSFDYRFFSVNPDTFGTMSGEVLLSPKSFSSPVVISFHHLERGGRSYTSHLPAPGEYKSERLFPGSYLVSAYLDSNDNQRRDLGCLEPVVFSEPEVFFPDTVEVRSRWETEGVYLKFDLRFYRRSD